MTDFSGRCPHCESNGIIGEPCSASICAKRGYSFIPEEDFAQLAHEGDARFDPRIGTRMDEYLITGYLGSGGFGQVYLTRQLPILLKAALKVLNLGSLPEAGQKKIAEKFEIEAKALASLSHPNIVRLLKYGVTRDRPYLVMELVKGGRNLKNAFYDRISMGHEVAPSVVFGIVHQVVNALDAAHRNPSQPIIHRDIKPENIMLHAVPENPNFVKVLDFGLAKFVAGTAETTSIMGTPIYMAPEQLMRKEIGPWTDFYALGVVSFELLNGRCPFVGDSHSEVIAHKVDPDFDPVRILDDRDLSDEAKKFYRKALARNPKDRFQNADEFRRGLEDLQRTLESSGSRALKPSLGLDDSRTVATPEKKRNSETLGDVQFGHEHPGAVVRSKSTPMGTPSFMAQAGEKSSTSWLYGLIGGFAALVILLFSVGFPQDKPKNTDSGSSTRTIEGTVAQPVWSGLAGSAIWKVGNKWNLRVVRVASLERVDEGAPLEFLIRREIERVEKDDRGMLRVEIRETGGLLKPRLKVYQVTEHCMTELNNSSRKWCVEDFSKELKGVEALGQKTEAFEAQADSYKILFSPEYGWIREDQLQSGTGRRTTRIVKGILRDEEGLGNWQQIPMPCSWDRSLSSGELKGYAEEEGTPETRKALEKGLEGPIYSYKLKLSGQYGFESVRALRDQKSTFIELIGTHEVEILKTLKKGYRLQQVKTWVNTLEPAEYVIFKMKGERQSGFVVIRMAVDGVSTEFLTVRNARANHSLALISHGKTCQLQVQRVKSGSRIVRRFGFGSEQLETRAGSLKVKASSLKLESDEVPQ